MPNSALLDHYAGQKADLERQVQSITDLAFSRADKSLSDQDKENLGVLHGKLKEVVANLDTIATTVEMSRSASDALAANHVSRDFTGHQYATEGQVLWDLIHRGDNEAASFRWNQFQARAKSGHPQGEALNRAAQHMGTTAENTVAVAGGFGGLFVHPVRGPIVDLAPANTPFLTLLAPQPVEAPGPFMRPRIVDPDLFTAAGPQAGGKEKGELPSKKWDYANDLVTPTTVGNYINLSLQAQTWVPQSLQAVVDHLKLRTELGLETRAVAEAARTTNVVALAPGADAKAIQEAVWEAMARVFTRTNRPAEWMVAGPLGVAMLGSTVDLANRPLFPFVGPSNAQGTASGFGIIAPFGLQFAQTHAIDDTTIYVGNSVGLEAYVYRYPILESIEASILGKQIAAAADVGFFHPTTTEATTGGSPTPAKMEAIVKIGS